MRTELPVKILARLANLMMGAVALLALLALLGVTIAPLAFGYRPYVVLSGSMAPAIRTGALIFAVPTDPKALKVGDVITYQRSDVNESVTHRIAEVKDDTSIPTFVTKGDANPTADTWTASYVPGNMAGKVVISVPYMGYAYHFLGSPQGRTMFVVVPVVVLSLMWLWQIWRPQIGPLRHDVEIPKGIAPEPEPDPGKVQSADTALGQPAGAEISISMPLRQ